ncbi:MAG TPA: hypothetical protein VKP30_11215 [Polyangiaceae bacterium]|nr:hypothetical protein [Polyangiaceae bacterium]
MVVENTPTRAAISQLGSIDAQLAELAQMTVPELVAKYFELCGEPTRTPEQGLPDKTPELACPGDR